RVADLVLRPHDSLRQRWRRRQEGTRNLLCRQPTYLAQRERHLRILRERRVAAGEDEAQPIILDRLALGRLLGRERLGVLLFQRIEARASANGVDRLEAAGRDQPGARIVGQPLRRPLLERGAKRFVQRFLGEVEVTEQPHQRREHAARLRTVNRLDLRIRGQGRNYSGWMPASRIARPQTSYCCFA